MAIFRVKSTRLREQYGQMARAKRHYFPDMGSSLCLTHKVKEKSKTLILSYHQRVSGLKNITEKLKAYM